MEDYFREYIIASDEPINMKKKVYSRLARSDCYTEIRKYVKLPNLKTITPLQVKWSVPKLFSLTVRWSDSSIVRHNRNYLTISVARKTRYMYDYNLTIVEVSQTGH
jgi:hypothetical protein